MSDLDLGAFSEGFASWRKVLAGAQDHESSIRIFRNAANDVATYLGKGLDIATAADELADMAVTYGLNNDDEVQTIIARAFDQRDRVSDPKPKPNGHAKHTRVHFKLMPFEAIKVSAEPNYLIKGILPRIGLAVIWGPPKCGKSFWTFDAVMHIALGRPYRGHRTRQGTVVYCALEGGSGFANRVEAWRQSYLTDYTGGPIPFYLLDVPIDLVADRERLIDSIKFQLAEPPAIIVIDTLNRALVGDENKSEDMAKLIRAADLLRVSFGSLVILVHHCGVAGNRPRGHTSLAAADDVQIAITRDEAGNILAKLEWMKDADAAVPMGAKLERMTVGTDADGDELTSCVIVPAEISDDNGPKIKKGPYRVLQALNETLAEMGEVPPENNRIPTGTNACKVEQWRDHYYRVRLADKQDTKKKAFWRGVEELKDQGIIGVWNDLVWLSGQAGQGGTLDKMSRGD